MAPSVASVVPVTSRLARLLASLDPYGLPIACSNSSAQLLANFSYAESNTLTTTGKAACIGMMLRDDYDPASGTFSSSSPYPVLEVEICNWWSNTLTRNGSFRSVAISGSTYELCLQNNTSVDGLSTWPSYIFVASVNILNVVDLSLMPFVRYVRQFVVSLPGSYITGVSFGYRFYAGKGSFLYATEPQLVCTVT